MKKKLLSMSLALFLRASFNVSNAQSVEEGNVLIDVYSGGPNLYTSVLETIYINSGAEENIVFGGIPAIGGRFGYMATDNISVGFEFNYTTTTIDFTEQSGTNNYSYNLSVPRIRAMFRFELHFGQSDKFDFYWPIAAGYNSTKFNITSSDPDFIPETVTTLIPLAFRTGIGARYYIIENLGVNLELGLGGGPIIEGGIALKF